MIQFVIEFKYTVAVPFVIQHIWDAIETLGEKTDQATAEDNFKFKEKKIIISNHFKNDLPLLQF